MEKLFRENDFIRLVGFQDSKHDIAKFVHDGGNGNGMMFALGTFFVIDSF